MKRIIPGLVILALLGLTLDVAVAQTGTSEVRGTIADRDGNGLPGVDVRFHPKREPDRIYKGKTNKKGRFFITGLWTPQHDNLWVMKIDLPEGMAPANVRIETRTVNRTLLGDIMELPLKWGGSIPEFPIAKLGNARVDVTLADEQVLMAEAREAAAAGAGAGAVAGASGGEPVESAPAARKKDPWEEATTLANAGEFEASLPFFEKALEDEPESVERYETFGKVLAHLERYDDATAAIDRVLAMDPDRVDALLVKSQIAIKTGEYDAARAALARASELSPGDGRVFEQLAYVAQEDGDTVEQIAVYEMMVDAQPGNAEAWIALGDLYAREGRMEDSAAAYGKVVEIDPDNAYRTYYNIAVLILKRDDGTPEALQRAVDALRRAVEIKPDYAQAHKQLGITLIGTGDRAAAVASLEKYVKLQPSAPDAGQMKALIASLKQ